MANNTTRSFSYKASRDIISTLIGSTIAFIGLFVIKAVLARLLCDNPDVEKIIALFNWIYVDIVALFIISCWISIYSKTYSHLSIKTREIVYSSGWLSKNTTSIPVHKIRSCSKKSGPLQRACNTMDISITTAGDDAEIRFHNINNGQIAYQMLCKIAMENEQETQAAYQILYKLINKNEQ